MVSIKGTAKKTVSGIAGKGAMAFLGILASRTILSRLVGDNTIQSAALKGVAGAIAGPTIGPAVAVGVFADSVGDIYSALVGGGPASGGGGGRVL